MAKVKIPPRRGRGRPDEGARERVLDAATSLFIQRDYDDVSIGQILARARVSRGALYHHFSGKHDLFRAVWAATEERAIARIAKATADSETPLEALLAAARAYLEEAETSLELRRIGLLQSRAVLGWEGWRTAASALGLGVARALLAAAMDAGEIKRRDLDLTSQVVLGAIIEGATVIATSPKPAAVRAEVEELVTDLIEALR